MNICKKLRWIILINFKILGLKYIKESTDLEMLSKLQEENRRLKEKIKHLEKSMADLQERKKTVPKSPPKKNPVQFTSELLKNHFC